MHACVVFDKHGLFAYRLQVARVCDAQIRLLRLQPHLEIHRQSVLLLLQLLMIRDK
jgi:hypothetical protein